jgi:hypothetical protein
VKYSFAAGGTIGATFVSMMTQTLSYEKEIYWISQRDGHKLFMTMPWQRLEQCSSNISD